jgi:hypothetical protein
MLGGHRAHHPEAKMWGGEETVMGAQRKAHCPESEKGGGGSRPLRGRRAPRPEAENLREEGGLSRDIEHPARRQKTWGGKRTITRVQSRPPEGTEESEENIALSRRVQRASLRVIETRGGPANR